MLGTAIGIKGPLIVIIEFISTCVTFVKRFHNDVHNAHKSTLKSCEIFDIVNYDLNIG